MLKATSPIAFTGELTETYVDTPPLKLLAGIV